MFFCSLLDLRQRSFAIFSSLPSAPAKGLNLLYGGNGQGKTSLLEALWMFTGLTSFRTNRAAEIIRFGSSVCQATLEFLRDEREQQAQLEIRRQPTRRRFWVNGVPRQPGSPELSFSMVLFTPDDLGLLKNGPVQRRELLDTVLCQLYPRYRKNLSEYQRCLAQRNTLLKAAAKSGQDQRVQNQSLLEVLDAALSKLGVYLVRERASLTGRLAFHADRLYQRISGGNEKLAVCYQSGAFPSLCTPRAGRFQRLSGGGLRLPARSLGAGCGRFKRSGASYFGIRTRGAGTFFLRSAPIPPQSGPGRRFYHRRGPSR